MFKFSVLVCAAAVMALTTAAFADVLPDPNDPAFNESGIASCPTSPAWCASVGMAQDPISQKTTLEYIFDAKIGTVLAGDLLLTEGTLLGPVDDVIRFENINNTGVAFIFSADIAGGLAADVGLPATYQGITAKVAETAEPGYTTFTPGAGQPGYSLTGKNNGFATYGLQSFDIVPEPSSVLLFGTALLIAARAFRRYQRRQ